MIGVVLTISDLHPSVDPLTGAVHDDSFGFGLTAADGCALETALRLAEATSTPLEVVAIAPDAAGNVLGEVAAFGVATTRIDVSALVVDERALAAQVAGLLAGATLVLTGWTDTGALPAFLAHELGAAQGLGLLTLEARGDRLVGVRRLDGGWREELDLPTPSVCSMEGGSLRLRRAPLSGALSPSPVRVIPGPAEPTGVGSPRPFRPSARPLPAPAGSPHERLLALTGAMEEHEPPVVMGPLPPVEGAGELLGFLARQGYLS